jgi:serine phosphatase RsbU (regulator of sigma subunit)
MYVIPVYILIVIAFATIKLFNKLFSKDLNLLLPAIGMLILFATNVNDSLYAIRVINSSYITYIGMFFYVVLQQIAKTIDYGNLLLQNIDLRTKLEYQNRYLAHLVEERTKVIEQQKNELLEKNEELAKQNEEILTQKEALELQKRKIDQQNKHLRASMEYASSIQKAILPTEQEIAKYFENFIFFKPKEIVSGDFYFFLPYDNNGQVCYFAAVVDCTGHGIPGAFMSLISYMILSKIIITNQTLEPKDILLEANREVITILHQKSNRNIDGFDISLIKIIPKSQDSYEVIFSGARLPLFYKNVSDKQVYRLRGISKSIGGFLSENELDFESSQIKFTLQKGSMLWLVSDGLIDQVNSEHKKFGTVRFMELLNRIAELDLATQKKIIIDTFYNWKGTEQQRDDVTVFGLKL